MADWEKEWQKVIEAIGTDFEKETSEWGADEVEKGAIRRFLEPLEFDSPLHYDEEIAKEYGYDHVVAPYSSLLTWTIPAHWKSGAELFTEADRNALPNYSPLVDIEIDIAPKTTEYFATDIEIDYYHPVVVGDRLRRVGHVLLSCVPKETKVGRGAFMTWESEIQNQRHETVAILRMGTYSYNPFSTEETD